MLSIESLRVFIQHREWRGTETERGLDRWLLHMLSTFIPFLFFMFFGLLYNFKFIIFPPFCHISNIQFSQLAIFHPCFLFIPPLFWFPHLLIRDCSFSVMEEQIRGKYNISQVKKYCISRKYSCVEYFQDLENLRVKYHGLMGRVKMK